ncbi:MAG: aminotransferase class III-fold pyridoxal phosphate-dependent enzyme [SAR202 cluster bacterium]|nr:aminotransferase class III-fold pyridoxal phosphate-dependent enzyme [SAR202 cluster bacterium]|tara:strand:+ start:1879 stop:3231 length:1353 start_codon:yes stop_codon:yes gene_type:complete
MGNSDNNVFYGSFGKEYLDIVRGEGVYIYDSNGKKYLDAASGVCVVSVGHGNEEIISAISNQIKQISFTYGVADNIPRQKLAKKLDEWAPSGMGNTKTIFSSSGAEANESAIKLSFQYHQERGNLNKTKIIGRWQSYHGNTVSTLSVGGRTSWRNSYAPLLHDSLHISPPYCYRCSSTDSHSSCAEYFANELQQVIQREGADNISAFIAEPIIGTSMSAVVPPKGYYEIIRSICDDNDIVFIADEVMSGMGRTGKKWGIEHWNVSPDIITTSKGVGAGYSPISVSIFSEKIWQAIASGSGSTTHSSTYGGNPLSCAVGCAVIDYIEKNDLISNAEVMGEKLMTKLSEELSDIPYVGDIRGKGLLIGIEIVSDKNSKDIFDPKLDLAHKIEDEARKNGLIILSGVPGLVNGVGGDHLEICPPYIIDEGHVNFIASTLKKSISDVIFSIEMV